MRSGWLAYEFTKLTHRDVLIGAALSLPKLGKALIAGEEAAVETAFVLLAELAAICEPSILERVGYGLDKVLATRLADSIEEIVVGNHENLCLRQIREKLKREELNDQLLDILLKIRDLSVPLPMLDKEPAVEGLVAAPAPSLFRTFRIARQLAETGEPIKWEMAARLQRLDFVVLNQLDFPDSGIVLGTDLSVHWEAKSDEIVVEIPLMEDIKSLLSTSTWQPADPTFKEGLRNGLAAAKDLLMHAGNSISSVHVTCTLRGILPPSEQLQGASAGLPLALRLLAERADLPMSGWLATGSINQRTLRIEPMTRDLVTRKLAAMKADGVNKQLLVYCSEPIDLPGVVNLEKPTLDAAACAIWGERWTEWVKENRSLRLRDLRFQERAADTVWAEGLTFNGKPLVVEVPQVSEFFHHFEKSHPTYGFLGGPSRCGKTWTAQQIADRAAQNGWRTMTLIPFESGLPRREDIRKAIEVCATRDSETKTLVILDDIEWDIGRDKFEDDIRDLCDLLRISLLAVIHSDDATDWKSTGAGLDGAPLVRQRQLIDFLDRLCEHPAFVSDGERLKTLASLIIKNSGRDLWLLMRLADLARQGGDFVSSITEFFAPKIHLLEKGELEKAQTLAALSLVGLDAPKWLLPDGYADQLSQIGAFQKTNERWSLPSRAAAVAVLNTTPYRPYQTEAAEQLGRFIIQAISRSESSEVVRTLNRLSNEAPNYLGKIHQKYRNPLYTWASTLGADLLARALMAMQVVLSPKERGEWSQSLVLSLSTFPQVTVSDLANSLDILHDNRFVLEQLKGGEADWLKLMESLPQIIADVLRIGKADSNARLQLLRAIWRLHEDSGEEALRSNWHSLLKFRPPYELADYKLVLESIEVARKLHGSSLDEDKFPVFDQLAEALIADEHADVYLARQLLRQTVARDDWPNVVFPKIAREFPNIINRSSPRQLCSGLSLLAKFNRSFAIGLLNHNANSLGNAIAARFQRLRSSGEMADLLFITGDIHSRSARRLLYEARPKGPKEDLEYLPRLPMVEAAAKAIVERGDGKGAGRLLKATLKVDNTFATINGGFSRKLVEKLDKAFFLKLCEWEPRTSILFHLLEGLIAVEAPFVGEILEGALDAIKLQIDSNMRPWAPRLALLLAESQTFASDVTSGLLTRLSCERLLRCTQEARTVEAQAYFHQLGTLLYQNQIPKEFSRRFNINPEAVTESIASAHRPEVIIRAAKAISHTLRRGGVKSAGEAVLSRLSSDWNRQLKRARTDGDLAETIRGLTALNPALGDEVVKNCRSDLQRRVMEALGRQPQVAAELLDAIENASPGLGSDIVREAKDTRAWAAVMREIAHEQDPRFQGTTYHMLARLGGYPDVREIDDVFSRWKEDIKNITSPAGLVMLLRALAAWDFERTQILGDGLSSSRLGTRIRGGARQDLEWAEALIGTCMNLGRDDLADDLLDALPPAERIPELLGPLQTAHLITMLRANNLPLGGRVAEAAIEVAKRESQRRFVLDDSKLLFEIGWLAFTVRQCYGLTLDVGDIPPWAYELPHSLLIVLWSHSWLESKPWTEAAVTAALASIESVPHSPSTCAATLIVAASRDSVDDLLVSFPAPLWEPATRASLYFVEAMLQASLTCTKLPLEISGSWLNARLDAPYERLHPARSRVVAMVSQIESAVN
jgi:hypothetical protein